MLASSDLFRSFSSDFAAEYFSIRDLQETLYDNRIDYRKFPHKRDDEGKICSVTAATFPGSGIPSMRHAFERFWRTIKCTPGGKHVLITRVKTRAKML